jgi:hypothetical protein
MIWREFLFWQEMGLFCKDCSNYRENAGYYGDASSALSPKVIKTGIPEPKEMHTFCGIFLEAAIGKWYTEDKPKEKGRIKC